MSGDVYPKYQLPSGNWTTDEDTADRLWARHEAKRPAEPWCNHDTPAVRNGVCECGEVVDQTSEQDVALARADSLAWAYAAEPDDITCGQADED